MRNLFIVCAFMFSALSFGQMSFALSNTVDVTTPMATTEANLGWFMNDDILVSFGMTDWDNFDVSARYYTGFCDNMFIEASTNAADTGDGTEYQVGVAAGWTKSLGIWKLQFEPMIAVDNIDELEPYIGWALRFNL